MKISYILWIRKQLILRYVSGREYTEKHTLFANTHVCIYSSFSTLFCTPEFPDLKKKHPCKIYKLTIVARLAAAASEMIIFFGSTFGKNCTKAANKRKSQNTSRKILYFSISIREKIFSLLFFVFFLSYLPLMKPQKGSRVLPSHFCGCMHFILHHYPQFSFNIIFKLATAIVVYCGCPARTFASHGEIFSTCRCECPKMESKRKKEQSSVRRKYKFVDLIFQFSISIFSSMFMCSWR